MKTMLRMAGLAAALGLAGCATSDPGAEPGAPSAGAVARAELRDASGRAVGSATATQSDGGIRIRVEGTSLSSGAHGAHVHTVGQCTPPDFASAGAHWNPSGAQHGKDNPAGMHAGDLPNILIGTDGAGTLEYVIPNGRMTGGSGAMLDADGAALVIHAGPDDYRTDPSGNSGGRIACGVFGPA